jgi:hypothetical protein
VCSRRALASGTWEYGFMQTLIVTTHNVEFVGGALVIFTWLCTGGTCVGAMDVAAMGMAILPIVELLEQGRGG